MTEKNNFEIYDNFLDAVTIIDKEKNIIYANQAMATLLDCSLKRLKTGTPIFNYITFDEDNHCLSPNSPLEQNCSSELKEVGFKSKFKKEGLAFITVHSYEDDLWIVYMRDNSLEIQLHNKYKEELSKKEEFIAKLQIATQELQKYSEKLEVMVEERTLELKEANNLLNAIINSLGQGLFVFNKEGECLPHYSRACDSLFITSPHNHKVDEVLKNSDLNHESIVSWKEGIFNNLLPFEDMAPLGPLNVQGKDGKDLTMEYFPLYKDKENLKGVVAVATDRTEEFKAQRQAKETESFAQMILKILKDKKQFSFAIREIKDLLQHLTKETDKDRDEWNWNILIRVIHSIKGTSALYSMASLANYAHKLEDKIISKVATEMIKTELADLELIFSSTLKKCEDFIGLAFDDKFDTSEISKDILIKFQKLLEAQTSHTDLLRDFIYLFMKKPIEDFFRPFIDELLDLAQKMGKTPPKIEQDFSEIRILPAPYKHFFTNLIHLFRNIADHGIESPEVRLEASKDKIPRVTIQAHFIDESQKMIEILIEDDGKGIDPDLIRKKTGLRKSDMEIIQHIFDDSYSSKTDVSEISGRGVGLSALKESVLEMGGSIMVASMSGSGTSFKIALPYH